MARCGSFAFFCLINGGASGDKNRIKTPARFLSLRLVGVSCSVFMRASSQQPAQDIPTVAYATQKTSWQKPRLRLKTTVSLIFIL